VNTGGIDDDGTRASRLEDKAVRKPDLIATES